jgi:inosine/xanthosine triphosphatase
MKINIGSTNQVKVNALKEMLPLYDLLKDADVVSVNVSSDVSEQPKSIDETITGAKNRARNAFQDCDLSFGIESGLMPVPHTKSGVMGFCACAIFDGKEYHLGLNSSFEYPPRMIELVQKEGLAIDQAVFKIGLTKNEHQGRSSGVIGLLTNGRLDRKEYTKQAIMMALIHIEHPELYTS